jgi:hypothetical protein
MGFLRTIGLGALILVAAAAAGCAAASDPVLARCGSDYTCLRDTMFQYRQQAAELSALAQRYELEAQAKAKEMGQDAEQVVKSREMAKQLRAEARQADELARDAQRQLPHNMKY